MVNLLWQESFNRTVTEVQDEMTYNEARELADNLGVSLQEALDAAHNASD